MKFFYEYRTSDNVRHQGELNAASRDAAFKALKAQGIRPSRVEECPGFFNKLFGKGKRWIAIGVLTIAIVALIVIIAKGGGRPKPDYSIASPRHQIYGDPATLREIDLSYKALFTNVVEQCMFKFMIPGKPSALETTPEVEVKETDYTYVPFMPEDSKELREIKSVLNWMKDELRDFMAKGGSWRGYLRALAQRQLEECQIRRRVEIDLKNQTDPHVWARLNKKLREIGIETIPMPEVE